MYDIITFGSAGQDILVRPKKLTSLKYSKESLGVGQVCFPLGSKIDVEDMEFYSGGGGTNVAATFALQGFKTAFCGMVGNDVSGQKIVNELKSLKINVKLVFKTKEKPSNHSIIIFGNNTDRTIFAYRGASELMEKNVIPWNKLKNLLRPGLRKGNAKWLYLAPLTGLLCDAFSDIVDFAQKNKIKVAMNPGIAQLSLPAFPEIAQKTDILILNQEEASFLTKIPFENENEIFKKIDEIFPGIIVMTKGEKGVVVSDGKYIYSAKPHIERKIVDTTGAGDSFGSGFLTDYIRCNGDIEKAIQLGFGNSAGCLSQIGAKNGLLKKGEDFYRVEVTKEECDNEVCVVK